jgi:hypothetical protein
MKGNRKTYVIGQMLGQCVYLGNDFHVGKERVRYSDFLCFCGTIFTGRTGSVAFGSKSCGCARRDRFKKNKKVSELQEGPKKKYPKLPGYDIWGTMKQRCLNPKSKKYVRYGAKGIKICDRWIDSFESFIEDMGPPPSPKHSLDRYPNKYGNYEPSNCRWATAVEQNHNKTNNLEITYNSKTKCLDEWCREFGIPYETAYSRFRKGYPVEFLFFNGPLPEGVIRRRGKAKTKEV